jgi:hypothetical protein
MCSAGNQAQVIGSEWVSGQRLWRILQDMGMRAPHRLAPSSRSGSLCYWLMYQYPTLLFTELAYHMRPCESMKNSRMEISECG